MDPLTFGVFVAIGVFATITTFKSVSPADVVCAFIAAVSFGIAAAGAAG